MSAELPRDLPAPKPISYDDASARIRTLAASLPRRTRRVPVSDSLGQVLAEAPRTAHSVPGFRHSAMDGYALPRLLAPFRVGQCFAIGGSALAGQTAPNLVETAALAVATGSLVPDAYAAVIAKEQVQVRDGQLELLAEIGNEANIRQADDDFGSDELIAPIGTRIDPALLATLATIGVQHVSVFERPRVAIVVTGDEVLPSGSPWQLGHRLDSNGPLLESWAAEWGFACTRHGPIADDPQVLKALIADLASRHDLLLVTGGASVGPADYTPRLFQELGDIAFWRVAVRPGMPALAARIGHCIALGLPGNPVAVFAGLFAFVGPLLRNWFSMPEPPVIAARLESPIDKNHKRLEWRRGLLRFDAQGQAWVKPSAQVSSGAMRSVIQSNVLIVLAADQSSWLAEDLVPVHPVRALI